MKIAVLGWGSLIWEPRSLQLAAGFVAFGPVLPIEFSRVSGGNRLTLVIDESRGALCRTYFATSMLNELDAALLNLWVREGTGDEPLPQRVRDSTRVAFVDIAAGTANEHALLHNPKSVETIRSWAVDNTFDAVIWTGLVSNFEAKKGKSFSVLSALEHVAGVGNGGLETVLHYIWNAPPEVQTPVRAAVTARWPQG